MDLSAFEKAINTLESSLDSLGGWLTFWTTLVVIGLIVEYAEDLRDLLIERPFDWKLFRTIIGGLLITVGVAGELFVQFKASKEETHLRTANHKVMGLLAEIAERERLETVRLKSLLAPRRLTEDQQKGIATRLAKYSGIPVDVFVLTQETRPTMDEALHFGRDIVGALGTSMDASGHVGLACSPWPVVGLIVQAKQDESQDRYAAGEILESFKKAGIEALPYIPPVQIPPCAAFTGLPSTKPSNPNKRPGWAKIVIIIGKRTTPILK